MELKVDFVIFFFHKALKCNGIKKKKNFCNDRKKTNDLGTEMAVKKALCGSKSHVNWIF